jgi:hypothetical protein
MKELRDFGSLSDCIYSIGAMSSWPGRSDAALLLGDLWGVVTFYNPAQYPNKLENLKVAVKSMRRQGLNVLIVEAVVPGNASEVESSVGDIVYKVAAPSCLWLKECLINLAAAILPKTCDKVVWLDADIVFTDDLWVSKLTKLLDQFIVVQPFSVAHWLKRGFSALSHEGIQRSSFGAAFSETVVGGEQTMAGHVGFAWASRRSVLLDCGLYDRFVLGGGDFIVTAAMYGRSINWFFSLLRNEALAQHIREWMVDFHASVRGSVGYLSGNVYHLWHGDRRDRGYMSRYALLSEANFDPTIDVDLLPNGVIAWSSRKTILHSRAADYFISRREY